ncbi:hypothetical protein ACFE04_015522 [Oxalis oulophora]
MNVGKQDTNFLGNPIAEANCGSNPILVWPKPIIPTTTTPSAKPSNKNVDAQEKVKLRTPSNLPRFYPLRRQHHDQLAGFGNPTGSVDKVDFAYLVVAAWFGRRVVTVIPRSGPTIIADCGIAADRAYGIKRCLQFVILSSCKACRAFNSSTQYPTNIVNVLTTKKISSMI